MADPSAVDTAVIALLTADASLQALLPGGVHFALAPQGQTAFTLVALEEATTESQFSDDPADRIAFEDLTYAVTAVVMSSATAQAMDAAARIDALLHDQPLTVTGYSWLSTVRVGRIRAAPETEPMDKTIRWQQHGGRYRVQVAPA